VGRQVCLGQGACARRDLLLAAPNLLGPMLQAKLCVAGLGQFLFQSGHGAGLAAGLFQGLLRSLQRLLGAGVLGLQLRQAGGQVGMLHGQTVPFFAGIFQRGMLYLKQGAGHLQGLARVLVGPRSA
jgi:hypothetical protein